MKLKLLAMGIVVTLSLNASASQLWNVDFGTGSGNMSGAGVVGSAGDTWNITGTNPSTSPVALSLGDSDGDFGNTIGFTYTGTAGSFGFNAGPGASPVELFDGFAGGLNGGGGSSFAQITYDLTGLNANTQYDIVAYGASQAGTDRGTHFFETVGGSILGSTDGSTVTITGADMGKSYTTFSITSSGTGTITFHSNYNSGSSAQGPVNGFQIEAIPEPATIGMIALMGGGMLFIRRRFMI